MRHLRKHLSVLRKHLSVANVLSCLALFVALSGVAYAATLGKNAVKTRNIAKGAVTAPKLRGGAVTTGKLAEEAVTRVKLAKSAVNTEKIAGNAVQYGQLAKDAVGVSKILDGAVTESKISETVLNRIFKNLSYVTGKSDSNTNPSKSADAVCPFGKQAVGGGAQIVGTTTGVAITRSMPGISGPTNEARAWSVEAKAVGAEGNPWSVEAFAVCAELRPS